jgi:hypothetical protein
MLTQRVFDEIMSDPQYIGYIIPDKGNNQLILHKNGDVGLKIKTENGRERKLGSLLGGALYTYRKSKHIHDASNSIGFNYHLLKDVAFIEKVMLQLENSYYDIPKKKILEEGKCLNFKKASDGNDFELQVFFPLELLKNYEL